MKSTLPHLFVFTLVAATGILIENTSAHAQSINTGDINNEAEFCVDVNDNTTVIGGVLPSPQPSNCPPNSTATPQPSPTVSPQPSPNASPSTPPASPQPTPTTTPASPTPTPTATPTSSPGTGGPSGQGKTSALGYDTGCPTPDVLVTYDAKQEGNNVEGVLVKFTYNGETREVRTNNSGRAAVSFRRAGNEQSVHADGEGDYPDQSTVVKIPDCPSTSSSSSSSSDAGRGGQVLGSSTPSSYAAAGSGLSMNQFLAVFGSWLAGLGYYMKRPE